MTNTYKGHQPEDDQKFNFAVNNNINILNSDNASDHSSQWQQVSSTGPFTSPPTKLPRIGNKKKRVSPLTKERLKPAAFEELHHLAGRAILKGSKLRGMLGQIEMNVQGTKPAGLTVLDELNAALALSADLI